LAQTEFNEIIQLQIHKGGIVAPHSLPIKVLFYVSSGNGIITINNNSISVSTGDIIEVKENMNRSWNNPNQETLELLVIKQKK